ncbi:MAG: DEAD/DEAH box helicase [Leptolyngbyaceae cyanobacterium SM1_3_5]|nr:DEAD/DEAH box helicase [Leptolyngbyaceae cyanobacterium SM1_3_5]
MPLFEIPSSDGYHSDVVFIRDPNNGSDRFFTHYSYTRGATANINEITDRRGIPSNNFRGWSWYETEFPEVVQRIYDSREYFPGESVLGNSPIDQDFYVNTVMRLGALEILANIFSGRITANDKDPFPHQLALQQYMKDNGTRVNRLLIADEVGLGKTIEIGLVLRDLLIAKGSFERFRCLYLTKAGLVEDACLKLQSVMKGALTVDGQNQNIVQVVDSFRSYGKNNTSGIQVASIDAARLYVEESDKEDLPKEVRPEILIIDECHHCGSSEELNRTERIRLATQTYKAAYQLISGEYWQESESPKLVVLMSATPFRSSTQFINLLRLISHQTTVENAFSTDVRESHLVAELKKEDSTAAVIWRQQNNVSGWDGQPLFPRLTVDRIKLETTLEYLDIMGEVRATVQRICLDNGESFGGFATRQLEMRLTSSSIAGAIWLFRWCIRHKTWRTQAIYRQDTSESTESLRRLIIQISQRIAEFDLGSPNKYADVSFPSDSFHFRLANLAGGGKVDDIYRFSESLRKKDDEDKGFSATPSEILELTTLAARLLNFSASSQNEGVENAKLHWLKRMLEEYPDSRFLVFTEILQTCEIITKALPKISDKLTGSMGDSERERAVRRFRGEEKPAIRVLVATSAADEGFDFQVANRVVHWDLSSSPAVLMQRNGRVARLGQVCDVVAYYLMMTETHEARREEILHEKFNQLGIADEQLRLRILGSLDEDEVETAVEEQPVIIDELLRKAGEQNQKMNDNLGKLQKDLIAKAVIDRAMLAQRLEYWVKLGLPLRDQAEFKLNFNTVEWQRPIFAVNQATTSETAQAVVATIKRKDENWKANKITFDPEFNLFGGGSDTYSLAGLRPWVKDERRGKDGDVWKHRPLKRADSIGDLACSLARQRQADFTIVSGNSLFKAIPSLVGSRYLLFATHPMLEVEENFGDSGLSYLTFYAFGDSLSSPIQPNGYSADCVNQVIQLLEKEAVQNNVDVVDHSLLEEAREAGKEISEWLSQSRVLPRLGQQKYFLPIPVALVAITQSSS